MEQPVLLLLLIAFAILILFFTKRVNEDRSPALRSILAFDVIRQLIARAIEAGRTLHLSLGKGGVATAVSADTLAGLEMLDHISKQTTISGQSPLITMADPTTMLMAQNTIRKAYKKNKQGAIEAARQVHWVAPEQTAYASGTMSLINMNAKNIEGNILIGQFGDEYLLIGEAGYQSETPITTVAGASDPNVLPLVYATAPQGLWGEELYAAGAYLSQKPSHIGSLLAQDTIRWVLGLIILGSVIFKAFGLF